MRRCQLRSFPRSLLLLLSLAPLALACDRAHDTDAPQAPGAGGGDEPSAAAGEELEPLEAPIVQLGAPDPELDPLLPVEAVSYELPKQTRRALLGRPGSGAKMPKKLGAGGKLMVAIDSPYQLFARDSTYVHVAAWKPNGKPASGASVYVGGREVGRTDRSGTLVYRHDQPEEDENFDYSMRAITVVDAAGRCGEVEFSPYQRTPSFASDELFIYSDRGVYRPGETVHVRGLGWRLSDDYAPLSGAQIEVTLRDSRGHTIAGATPTSDEQGVLSLDLELPLSAAEGLYELRVAYGQARALGRLQVRNFETPAITIEHTLGRFLTRDADALDFELELGLASGGKLGASTLELAALSPSDELLFERELQLQGPGPHAISLSQDELEALKQGVSEDQFGRMRLRVSDDQGRRDEVQRELRVTQNPYVAVLELDKDQYATGELVSLVTRITDRDRVPTRDTPLSVELVASDGTKQVLSARTDQKGTATIEFPMPAQGGSVSLHLPELDKPVAATTLPWIQSRPMQSKLDQMVVNEGATAKLVVRFPAGYRPADKWVHVDVVDTSGALVNAALLEVGKEQGEWVARGEFQAPTWGSMLLTLFALGERDQGQTGAGEFGLLTEGQNLVVHPDKELEITLEGFAEQAAPGETLDVRARVRDPDGKPVDAAVGVALVDASVIDLKDPLEITPMDRFYNPELRTLSTTGSKILTWPVVSRNWGAGQIDIALPPFHYMDGGGINACGGGPSGGYAVGFGGASGSASSVGIGGAAKKSKTKSSKSYDFEDDSLEGELLEPEAEFLAGPMGGAASGAVGGAPAMEPPPPPAPGAAPQAGEGAGRSQGAGPQRAPQAKITVRTQLPDTSLWAPDLQAKQGQLQLRATLPESIGEQELIVVASDERGGVGVHRERVRVTQPVHVRADLPARLIVGEQLELPIALRNNTDARHDFVVELNGLGQTQQSSLRVGSATSEALSLPLAASRPGTATLTVRGAGGGYDDSEQRELQVVHAGVPLSSFQHGSLSKGAPLKFDYSFADDGSEAILRVRFPTLSGAFLELDQLQSTLRDDPDAVAVDLVSASLILGWAARNQQQTAQLKQLRERALGHISLLRLFQRPDGGYGYWRNGEPSPYVTGWVLEGLLEAHAAGLPEAKDTIHNAANFIAANIDPAGLVSVDDIDWWEGSSETVRLGLSAELYSVLARVPKQLRTSQVNGALERLDKRMAEYIAGDELDPLTTGHAIVGLGRRGKLSPKQARELVRRLLQSRDEAHWEPSWFHAYGGRIEASAALVEVMHEVDPQLFAVEIRDALAWLMSTREAWGSWHAERGTSAALRAILRTGGAPFETPSTVKLWVDGKLHRTITIDPADPYLSAMALAQLDLPTTGAGKHAIKLRYDGQLSPSVELETRAWSRGKGAKASQSKGGNSSLRVRTDAGAQVGVGAKLELRVNYSGPKRAGGTIVVGASNLFEVDLPALAAWVGPGRKLRSARLVEGRVELELAPTTEDLTFKVPLRAIRGGRGPLPSVAWLPRSGSKAEPMVVYAGEVELR